MSVTLVLMVAMVAAGGCGRPGGGPVSMPSSTAAAEETGSDDLDRALARYSRWLSDDTRTAMVALRRSIGFSSARDSLGHEAFAGCSPAEQQARRDEAAKLVQRARRSIVDRYRLLGPADMGEILKQGWLFTLDEVLTRSLNRLHTAVGLDPTSNDAWYDLAVSCQTIGDRDGASRARRIFLRQTAGADGQERARRSRAVLDEAWHLREDGRFARCRTWLEAHGASLMTAPTPHQGLRPTVESDLIMGLLAAEDRDLTEAMRWINRLPLVEIREGLSRRPSEYLRKWVHIWYDLRAGDHANATHRLARQRFLRLHADVGWRFWQDMGNVCAAVGDEPLAARFWLGAMMHRPLSGFYPRAVLQGPTATMGLEATDQPYVIAYRTHWVGGSLWGFTATRALLCQVHGPEEQPQLWREAMAALDRCIRRGVEPGQSRLLRARLNLQRGQLDAAEDDLRHAAVQQLAAGASGGEVAFLRGVAAINSGRLAAGIDLLERATEENPKGVRSWQTLAVCYAYLGRDDEAREAFDNTVRLAPSDGSAFFNRGLFHLQAGRRAEAESDLLLAVQLLDDDSRVIHLLQTIATGREIEIDASPSPVKLVASDRELDQARQLETVMSAGVADMATALGETPEERALWLDLLEQRYARTPTPAARCKLAEARSLLGQHREVAALLAEQWPDGLRSQERRLLLEADRALGHTDRAQGLAGLDPAGLEVATVVTGVVLLHDAGLAGEASELLTTARTWWPSQPALDELVNRLR